MLWLCLYFASKAYKQYQYSMRRAEAERGHGMNTSDSAKWMGISTSGVNVTDDAAPKIRPQHSPFRPVVADTFVVARHRSAQPRLSTRPVQVHQSAAFWQTQKAGLRSRMRAESSTEIEMKSAQL
jgi:hypothetical protein